MTLLIHLDLLATFDIIVFDTGILLDYLLGFGQGGIILLWFLSCTEGRIQRVSLGGCCLVPSLVAYIGMVVVWDGCGLTI